MKKHGKIILTLLAAVFLLVTYVNAQSVKVTEEEEKPYLLDSEGKSLQGSRGLFSRKKRTSLKNATNTYLMVYLGPNGQIENMSADSLAKTGLANLKFPSLNFTISAASKLLISSPAGSGKIKNRIRTVTGLRQMSLRVRIDALDADRKRIRNLNRKDKKFGSEPLLVLSIFPSDVATGGSKAAGKVGRAADKVDAIAQHLGPLGGIATSVTALFRTFLPAKDHISQIAYMKSANAFGWIWREAEGASIEGIHKCMVLLRTIDKVKYLNVKVDLITDWRRYGAWMKTYRYIIPVKADNDL